MIRDDIYLLPGAHDDHLIKGKGEDDPSDQAGEAEHGTNKISELMGIIIYFCYSNLRVSDVYTHIKSSPQDQINLVPPAPIPVQAGPGDHPLGRRTLVPRAEVEDVLPLLEDQDGEEVVSLVDVVGYGCTGGIQEEVVTHVNKVLAREHSVSSQDGEVPKLKYKFAL